MSDNITDKDIEHAIRTCSWRLTVNGQQNLHLCGGACNVCEKLIEDGRCDTLQRLFRKFDEERGEERQFEKQEPTQEAEAKAETWKA